MRLALFLGYWLLGAFLMGCAVFAMAMIVRMVVESTRAITGDGSGRKVAMCAFNALLALATIWGGVFLAGEIGDRTEYRGQVGLLVGAVFPGLIHVRGAWAAAMQVRPEASEVEQALPVKKEVGTETAPDLTGETSLGLCPKCGGAVFAGPDGYLCEGSKEDAKRCTFTVGGTILGQKIELDQVRKLLETGSTDLLKGFVSPSGKPFKAHLALGAKGKLEFELPEDAE
jgi:hypothetical protein